VLDKGLKARRRNRWPQATRARWHAGYTRVFPAASCPRSVCVSSRLQTLILACWLRVGVIEERQVGVRCEFTSGNLLVNQKLLVN